MICKFDAFIPNDSLLLPSDPLRAPYHQSRLPLPVLVRQDYVHQSPQDSRADGLCSRLLLLQLHPLLHGSLRGFQPLLARRPLMREPSRGCLNLHDRALPHPPLENSFWQTFKTATAIEGIWGWRQIQELQVRIHVRLWQNEPNIKQGCDW